MGILRVRDQIVEAGISRVIEAPERLSGKSIKRSLYKVVDGTAKDTILVEWRNGPLEVETYPEGEHHVVLSGARKPTFAPLADVRKSTGQRND